MLHTHIAFLRKFYISGLLAASFLLAFISLAIFPVANSFSGVQAASVVSETSLVMTVPDIDLALSVDSATGTFRESEAADFSVTTNNYSGYTLSIRAANDDENYSKLVNGESVLNSISSASDESGFNNGNWGFKPSKLNSASNDDFQPAPTYEGTTIDTTAVANNEANTYDISIGAKANYGLAAGKYSNTFIITAIANPVAYSISYNKNTGDTVTNMPENQSSDTTEDEVELSNLTPARANHIFHGWCDGATVRTNGIDTCATNTYQPGDTYYMDQTGLNDVTLTAMWEVTGYTINFDKNDVDATGTMESQVIAYNSSANLHANTFTKQDTVFDGWNTADDGTGADYADAASFTTPADTTGGNGITLYAKWRAETYYTITFDANGGTGSMGTQTIANGSTAALDENEFARSGYVFYGWNTSADGTGTGYGDEGNFTAPATGSTGTLYAQWVQSSKARGIVVPDVDPDTGQETGGSHLEYGITIQRAYELALTQAHRGMYEEITPGSGTYQYIDSWNGQEYQGQGRQVRFAMQDMWRTYSYEESGQTKTLSVCDLVSVIGDEYQALDTRDNKLYWIAKLADGKCWMTQNLDLNLVHVADNETPLYNHWNTDLGWYEGTITYDNSPDFIPSNYSANTYTIQQITGATSSRYEVTYIRDENKTWNPAKSTTSVANLTNDDSLYAPRSTDVGDWYYTDTYTPLTDKSLRNNYNYLSIGNNTFFSSTPYTGNGMHGHLGNYYNWNAAVALNDTSNIVVDHDNEMDIMQSICPAGWRLITASLGGIGMGSTDDEEMSTEDLNFYKDHWGDGTDKDHSHNDVGGIKVFYNNGNSSSSAGFESTPNYWTRAGTIRQGGMSNAGFDGYYWTNAAGYWNKTFYDTGVGSPTSTEQAFDVMVRSNIVDASDRYSRDRQRNIRCIAR